jgi:type I restriction enzyme S subunit
VKKLGEISTIQKGEQLNSDTLKMSGLFPALNGGINISGFTDKWNTEANTISISEGGNSCGYVNFNKEKFWSGGHCYTILEIDLRVDALYLFQALKYNELAIMRLRVGSGLPNIQKKNLNDFNIFIPNILEQKKIANFLTAIDEKINQQQSQIEKVSHYKKGLLQQMFC